MAAFFSTSHTLLWQRALKLALAPLLALSAFSAQAAGLTPKEEKEIVAVVQAQLNAFAADDAKKAFSFASPTIRKAMGNADNFMAMVRSEYQVVYRPASTAFLKPIGHANEAYVRVQLTDKDGDAWIATYTLERLKNRKWVITGCEVDQAVGTMV
jgi:hypothetical protein